MTSAEDPQVRKRLHDTVQTIIGLHGENYLLPNTTNDTIETLKSQYDKVSRGGGAYADMLKTLVRIYKENKDALGDVCTRCTGLENVKKLIVNAKTDLQMLSRVYAVKKDLLGAIPDADEVTNQWHMVNPVPNMPEYAYWINIRLAFVRFQPETSASMIIWDDKGGKFIKTDRYYR